MCPKRSILLLELVLCSLSLCSATLREEYFTQFLNPIDTFDTRQWENRYWIDTDSYTGNGPIFVYVTGAEINEGPARRANSHFFDLGREMGAVLVYTENRFYGLSRPTPNLSLENLQFLNRRATIEDLAHLLRYLKGTYGNAIIAHGVDQGAATAVWTRSMYPDLIQGIWVSAPMLAGVLDFGQNMVDLGGAIRQVGGDQCYEDVEEAFEIINALFDAADYATLEANFDVCDPFIADEQYLQTFSEQIHRGMAPHFRLGHAEGIQDFCGFLRDAENPMVGLGAFRRERVSSNCVATNVRNLMLPMTSIEWDPIGEMNGIRAFLYGGCAEYGRYRTTSPSHPNQPFGSRLPVDFFEYQCSLLFGSYFNSVTISRLIEINNQAFGGNRPNVTKVYITHGELDPYRSVGVLEPFGDEIYVDIIPNYSSYAEILPQTAETSDEIRRVQTRARELIMQWIAD